MRNPHHDVARMLRRQGMPRGEIRQLLGTDDPIEVLRYLELHEERLAERLDGQRHALDQVRELVAHAAIERRRRVTRRRRTCREPRAGSAVARLGP